MVISDKTYTITEFEEYAATHADLLLELIDGRIVEKVTSEEHGKIVINIGSELRLWQKRTGIKGHYSTESSHRLPDNISNERRPDVSFRVTDDKVSNKGKLYEMPDFAVEVKSINNSYDELREKAKFYIANGTCLVWLVYPTRRIVEVYFADGTSELFKEEHTLSGGDVLPEFEVKVSDIFDL
jgi:Uma2 family endonuclease